MPRTPFSEEPPLELSGRSDATTLPGNEELTKATVATAQGDGDI